MKIISSQRYINYDIVDKKLEDIRELNEVILSVTHLYNDIYILRDGHHTRVAALELGINIKYIEYNDNNCDSEWTRKELLENLWIDSDWYYIDTGNLVF